jgi:hypothetical protein
VLERTEAYLAYNNILVDWRKSKEVDDRKCEDGGEPVRLNLGNLSDQVDHLTRYIEMMQSSITIFFDVAFTKLAPKEKSDPGFYRLSMLSAVLTGIDLLNSESQEVAKTSIYKEKLDDIANLTERIIKNAQTLRIIPQRSTSNILSLACHSLLRLSNKPYVDMMKRLKMRCHSARLWHRETRNYRKPRLLSLEHGT